MTALNNGLSTSEVAQKIREVRHEKEPTHHTTSERYPLERTMARREIEYQRELKQANDCGIGHGILMTEPSMSDTRTKSKSGFHATPLLLNQGV